MICFGCKQPMETHVAGAYCDLCVRQRAIARQCATIGCLGLRREGGKSKYCPPCATKARAQWRDNIAASDAERQTRYARFERAYQEAAAAAYSASLAAKPTPMVVVEADGLSDQPKPGGKRYFVPEGACGFAWVTTAKGNSSFSRWVSKAHGARAAYRGGVTVFWCPGGSTQSIERQSVAAEAACCVLSQMIPEEKFYTGSRMD